MPKYNETDKQKPLKEGQFVYIKPKNNEASTPFYIVKDGDSVHSISQNFGVKSKYIYEWNKLSADQSVQPGQKLRLKRPGKG